MLDKSGPSISRLMRNPTENDHQARGHLATEPLLKRSPNFWFDDGSVILQVETILFRVHRSILCSHSSFFEDLFQIPQPTDEPSIEGCPVVCMHDAAVDWENLLMFVYFPAKLHNLHTVSGREFPFPILCSLLRLGHKYQFDAIKENALDHLKAKIPASLEEWDMNFEIVYVEKEDNHGVRDAWLLLREFDVINIALELGIQSVLPIAYYLCAITKSPHEIFHGSQCRGNGDTLTHLPPAAQYAIVQGQTELRKAMARSAQMSCVDNVLPTYACADKAQCTESFRLLSKSFLLRRAFDPRFALQYQGNLVHLYNLCPPCSSHIMSIYAHIRNNHWRSMPVFFGLPEWDDLKDFAV